MRVVVSYDITDDALRRQIGKICETFGQRVQRSVFECAISNEQLRELMRKLDIVRISDDAAPSDSIRVYRLCADCAVATSVLGYKPDIVTEIGHTVI